MSAHRAFLRKALHIEVQIRLGCFNGPRDIWKNGQLTTSAVENIELIGQLSPVLKSLHASSEVQGSATVLLKPDGSSPFQDEKEWTEDVMALWSGLVRVVNALRQLDLKRADVSLCTEMSYDQEITNMMDEKAEDVGQTIVKNAGEEALVFRV